MSKKLDKRPPSELNLEEGATVIKDDTCFGAYKRLNTTCNSESCRYFQNMNGKHQNCVINAAAEGPFTLQEVGDIFSVTRMRICQIEKASKQLLKNCIDENHL